MRSLVRQRAGALARLRCDSSLHRLTPSQALRGSTPLLTSPYVASIEDSSRRWYSTTAVLLKQPPTTPGSSSSLASTTASTRSSGRSKTVHRSSGAATVSARSAGAAAAAAGSGSSAVAAVEAELDSSTTPADAAAAAAAAAVAAHHRGSKAGSPGRTKAPRRGRRKQGSGAAAGAGSSSEPHAGGTTPARKRSLHGSADPPPVEPPVSTASAAEERNGTDSTASTTHGKKRAKDGRGKRRNASVSTTAATAAAASSSSSSQSSVMVEPSRPAAAAAPSPSFGAVPPVYSTHDVLNPSPQTDEQRMAERCSVTKLIMVSASVSFLFTALPKTEGKLKRSVRDMNRIQLPTPPAVTETSPAPAAPPALTAKQYFVLAQRLCAEQFANNTVFIHVREMEQLVPPLQLQPSNPGTSPFSADAASPSTMRDGAGSRKGRGRRSRRNRTDSVVTPSPPPPTAPATVALSPVERLLALQEWKKAAARQSKESQARYVVPPHFHAITRVRFHDPHQTDLTVVMGGGWSKSPNSVLRAIMRSMRQEQRGGGSSTDSGSGELESSEGGSGGDWVSTEEDDDDAGNGSIPPFPMPDMRFSSGELLSDSITAEDGEAAELPPFMSSPFAVKPLLTVCASCVPRREAWIGTCSPKPSTAAMTEVEGPYASRPLPSVPRYSTRITVMLEHDDMDPADLVSLAEISTPRKPSLSASSSSSNAHATASSTSDVSVRGGGVDVGGGDASYMSNGVLTRSDASRASPKRPLQLYCLVQDAGEF